tara:strand:+ start:66 stop:653 length:588 start_codon:yes stop_codon:yes gene_type:complete
MMSKEILNKGAIPRMTQEIYYICSSDGSKVVNIDLTLDRFRDKLKKIESTTVVIEELNRVHSMYRKAIDKSKDIPIKKYTQKEYRAFVDQIVMECIGQSEIERDEKDDVGQKYDPTLEDMYVCDYCGSEEVSQSGWANVNYPYKLIDFVEDSSFWCDSCEKESQIMTYFDWQEKIAEECMGNKDEYDKIMDGSRA